LPILGAPFGRINTKKRLHVRRERCSIPTFRGRKQPKAAPGCAALQARAARVQKESVAIPNIWRKCSSRTRYGLPFGRGGLSSDDRLLLGIPLPLGFPEVNIKIVEPKGIWVCCIYGIGIAGSSCMVWGSAWLGKRTISLTVGNRTAARRATGCSQHAAGITGLKRKSYLIFFLGSDTRRVAMLLKIGLPMCAAGSDCGIQRGSSVSRLVGVRRAKPSEANATRGQVARPSRISE
jgi:hypothetical protein